MCFSWHKITPIANSQGTQQLEQLWTSRQHHDIALAAYNKHINPEHPFPLS